MVVAVAEACICTVQAYNTNTCSEKGSGVTVRSHVLSGRVISRRVVCRCCEDYAPASVLVAPFVCDSPPSASVPFTNRPNSCTIHGQLDAPNASTMPS